MPTQYVSKIKTPDNSEYEIKDADAQTKLAALPKTFHIGAGYEYSTLRAGIAAAVQYPNSIVYVHPSSASDGSYDIGVEFNSEIAADLPDVEYGIGLCNDVHIIFTHSVYVYTTYDIAEPTANTVTCFAPFRAIDNGGYIIENLRMTAENCRYCIHDEGNSFTKPRNVKILNCQMTMKVTSGSPRKWYPQCIGGGFGLSDDILIDNCIFNSQFTSSSDMSYYYPYPAVSYHNNGSTTNAKCKVTVSNCHFINGTFRITHYGNSTFVSTGYLNNCDLPYSPIIKYETTTTTTPQNVQLISENNIIRDELSRIIDNNGSKNLNRQYSITALTNAAFSDFYPVDMPAGNYVVSLTKALTNSAAIAFYDDDASTTLIVQHTYSTYTGKEDWEFYLPSDATRFRIYFNNKNDTLNNIMICTKTMWDISQVNVPYIMNNAEIVEGLKYLVDSGAKNILDGVATTTVAPVTYTKNSDGSYTADSGGSGVTSTNGIDIVSSLTFDSVEPYVISGCPAGGGSGTYEFEIQTGASVIARDYGSGNGVVFTPELNTTYRVRILIRGSTTNPQVISNLVFKPMICKKTAWDISHKFVPYSPTNAELASTI